jgi:hypothetical protein
MSRIFLPPGSQLRKDTGFQGQEPGHVTTFQPNKKPPRPETVPSDKRLNSLIPKWRIGLEHALRGNKVNDLVAYTLRNFRLGFGDLVMQGSGGLHPFRLDFPLTAWLALCSTSLPAHRSVPVSVIADNVYDCYAVFALSFLPLPTI